MKNSINTYPYDIAAIILAYLRSEIDENGQQKLDVWLEEADSHKALFARIQDEKMQYEDIQKILSYETKSKTKKKEKAFDEDVSNCGCCGGCFGSSNDFLL